MSTRNRTSIYGGSIAKQTPAANATRYGAVAPKSLNPKLARALAAAFGGPIKVSNAGEEAIITRTLNALSGRYNLQVDHAGEHLRINCPFCGDTRHSLAINYRYGVNDENWFLAYCHNENSRTVCPIRGASRSCGWPSARSFQVTSELRKRTSGPESG